MDAIVKIAADQAMAAARSWLISLLAEKVKALGIDAKPEMVEALADHILNHGEGSFQWDDGGENLDRNLDIEFTVDDLANLDRLTTRICEAIPKVLKETTKKAGQSLLRDLKARWSDQHTYENVLHYGFQERLEERWGDALNLLRMLRTVSLEIGQDSLKAFRRSKSKKNLARRDVLIRLHARACQVLGEIILLMENGYADGAMARWRTLHEITVVALLISEGGEDLAQRYHDHEFVEAKRSIDMFSNVRQAHGRKPASERDHRRAQSNFDAVIKKYGKEFAGPYGWAAQYLKNLKPKFDDLEDEAGRAALRSQYKMASYNVHAGVKGISFRYGLRGEPGILAGASNAGLADPGEHAALAMTQMNFMLLQLRKLSVVNVSTMHFLMLLKNGIKRALAKAERKLEEDENDFRNQKA